MVGDLYSNFYRRNFVLAMSATALKIFFSFVEKEIVLDYFSLHFNGLGRFLNFEFLLCLKVVLGRFKKIFLPPSPTAVKNVKRYKFSRGIPQTPAFSFS
jgi:hypothetical protein